MPPTSLPVPIVVFQTGFSVRRSTAQYVPDFCPAPTSGWPPGPEKSCGEAPKSWSGPFATPSVAFQTSPAVAWK